MKQTKKMVEVEFTLKLPALLSTQATVEGLYAGERKRFLNETIETPLVSLSQHLPGGPFVLRFLT